MAESEERPSKIRKLNSSDGSTEPLQALQGDSPRVDLPSDQVAQDDCTEGEDSKFSKVPPTTNDSPLSRNQLKKLRKREQWEAGKEYRKEKRRMLHKEKQARKAEARKELNEKIANGEIEKPVVSKPKYRRPTQTPVAFVMDCDFNELMAEKELISLSAQITRSYADNKCNPFRAHLAISSWGGPLKDRFENVLASTHLSWKGVKFFEGDFVAAARELDGFMRGPEGGKLAGAFAKSEPSSVPAEIAEDSIIPEITNSKQALEIDSSEAKAADVEASVIKGDEPQHSIVYLTSDSETTLSVLSPYTTYIIGGIVDKNRHKGICYKRAVERGIPTARLPIGEYMTMQSRSVLAVNHVVEIMLAWLETGDWGEAFLKVIPKRKEAKLKTKGKDSQPVDKGEGGEQGESQDDDDDDDGEDQGEDNGASLKEASASPEGDETNGDRGTASAATSAT
ncbi:tRNA m(1)G methyltransferase domain-containing protein [Rhexocercosporidium sp. MPI-PUGE-AT-0058]|nr:tRNA m(1)G methyltransferase domain-containing protein [Rhexocercosporidium sp. MPI-PUGE-AT-0058]